MTKAKIPWTEFHSPERLTEEALCAAEAALGVRFPDDFIRLLVRHQGMVLEGWGIPFGDDEFASLGSVSYLTPTEDGTAGNLVSWCETLRRNGYPRDLVPFGGERGQVHLALDYSTTPPCVVYVYPREIYLKPGDTYSEPLRGSRTNGYWSTVKVADSITDMLAKLEPE